MNITTAVSWHNVSHPPDSPRPVRCLLATGEILDGFYWSKSRLWFRTDGLRMGETIQPVGWCEKREGQ